MGASQFVGRVGGLAVAFGAGVAIAGAGCAVAAADPGESTDAASRAVASAGPQASTRNRSAGTVKSAAPTADRVQRTAPRAAAAERPPAGAQSVRASAVVAPEAAAAAVESPAGPDEPAGVDALAPLALLGSGRAPAAATDSGGTDSGATATPSETAVEVDPVDSVDPDAPDAPEAAASPAVPGPAAATRPAAAAGLFPLPEVIPTVCTESSQACAYIVGPSGVPIPDEPYDQVAMAWYIEPNKPPNSPEGLVYSPQVIFTPEGAYPITGVKQLPIDPSSQEGLTEVRNTFEATLQVLQPGTPISYFGYSQSAIISSLFQIYQAGCSGSTCPPPAPPAPGDWPIEGLDPDQVTFVTVGQEMNPNGGWFSRFAGFTAPSPGLVFYGATPEEPWAGRTINYTLEYDGFADYPRYPLNFLSSLNAAMGIILVHTNYASRTYFQNVYGALDPQQAIDPVLATFGPAVACKDTSTTCKRLPTTPGTEDSQEYYFIPTPNLPLLAPLRAIPLIGNPIADLIQPALKVIVDLGYADWAHGFGTEADQPPANVLLEFGVFPDVDPLEVAGKLIAGVGQGISDFIAALLPGGSVSRELSAMGSAVAGMVSNAVSSIAQLASQPLRLPSLDDVLTTVQNVVSQVTGRISLAASALYATLLPLADFANALVIALPGYAFNLVTDGIQQALSGQFIEGLVNATGRPVAATVGFATIIGVFQFAVFALGAVAAITGCGPAAPVTGYCLVP